jgi:signal transduction histidine kinase
LRKRWPAKRILGYVGVLTACFVAGVVAGWTPIASRIDDYAVDWMFNLSPPVASAAPAALILAIDDATFNAMGGVRHYRSMLASGLELLAPAHPKLVAIDFILEDAGDPAEDARLAHAMAATPNLLLAADLVDKHWEDPLPLFRAHAAALGHVKPDEESRDGVTREIPLEKRTDKERHWALSLEAFRLFQGARILESPDDLQIGATLIPARVQNNRPLRVLYTQKIPALSLQELATEPNKAGRFTGRAVFFGVTSLSAADDRVQTPFSKISGVEANAEAFETLRRGHFLTPASNLSVLAVCASVAILAGLIFAFLPGPPAWLSGGALLAGAHVLLFALFRQGVLFPWFATLSSTWLTVAGAASYQYFVVRRQLRRSENERTRYQEAIHFVAHEMRTPLTAIQGSSELMGRYNLNEVKRKQIAEMINSESKRLSRMIQTFLDVERLSDGQMELKREPFEARQIFESCLDRVSPIAERKNIRIEREGDIEGALMGDRELMEYALYNLLTNAVKYSPPETEVRVSGRLEGGHVRLSVRDQGIGMDSKELKKIFQKFYRTRRAEASGEAGTGIGLSLVDQIVVHHGGRVEVTSEPGKGSCFTVVLPASEPARKAPRLSVSRD